MRISEERSTFVDDDIGLTALEAPSRWNSQALVSSMSEPEDILILSKSYHLFCLFSTFVHISPKNILVVWPFLSMLLY